MSPTSDPIRTWTRPEIEALALAEPESLSYLRVRISVRLLKSLIDFAAEHGTHIEIISAHAGQNGVDADLKFFRRG